ncbi:iron uptake porin [Synechococcus sp. UW86]|uniref:iron uptake porin n=1 Tax=Synechococcus sp. UW86 TaxID=368491 RepID=UPI000E0FB918|nr:iron uptake porin [Synechococcus sp. UW86]
MKLFQQLLVAPAALGLLATGANAAELNINGVSDYAASADQVTSVRQFSDVYPTDWAYQALSNLVDQYGCVAGYPNGAFRGNRAMTRFEAAALLNACLDRVTEVTDELRRLAAEFGTEMAILKGRVDGLEAKVGELRAAQFSTTTKLKGKATFVTGLMDSEAADAQADDDKFSFSYDYRLGLKTSFTGKDLLFARLRAGNMKGSGAGESAFSGGFRKLDVSGMKDNIVKLDRLYYKFPVGSGLTAIVGPMARNTESLGMKPTAYTVKTLNMFGGQFGAGNVYNKETGGLVGVIWKQKVAKGEPRLTAALNYVADDGEQASSGKGMFTAESKGNTTAQIGYGTKKWGAALGYRYGQCGAGFGTAYKAVKQSCGGDNVDSQNFALNGFWKPEETGFIPSVSLAYGWSDLEGSTVDEAQTWMVGLQWDKVANTPHTLAVGFGAPLYVESQAGTDPDAPEIAWEASLKYKVSSNITMIPAIFYLPESNSSQGVSGKEQFGAVLQTVFKF